MSRTTVDFGIDLGTTNSVISVANEGEIEIIKNNIHEITPSMVYFDKRGRVFRGHAADQNLGRVTSAADVQAEFKREMGQKITRTFEAAGKSMSPEELSAEILKELRSAAGARFGQEPAAAVITVPAMFELPQNDATARAAKLAGFEHSMLLQEPVAAATAYGFQSDTEKAYWLVYDYGGGTFDASIIAVRDGQLSVVRHSGDNYLGGADFERAIVDELIVPRLRDDFDFPNLERANEKSDKVTRGRLAVLKKIAEEVKKNLSRDEAENFYRENVFEDDSGDLVDVEFDLSRAAFEQMINSDVQKSIDITARLIQDAGLRPDDIEKVLLVGGSTFVPLVQQQVATLGIPMDRTMDPMTVVSYGAAVFASAQRMPKGVVAAAPVAAGAARLELEYEPVGKDLTPMIGGKVLVDGAVPPAGSVVVIDRADGGWTSGDLPLDGKGLFFTNVQLREKGQSAFKVKVRDAAGTQLECTPDSFAITYGMSVAKASLPQAISVGLADKTAEVLLAAGVSLPATSEVCRKKTVRELRRGSTDSLPIPFMSGDEEELELNRVGTIFMLKGTEISRDLHAGSDIEIVVEVDASMTTAVTITVPLLDQQFELKHASELEHEPVAVMRSRLRKIEERLDELEEKADASDEAAAGREVANYRASSVLEDIDRKIDLWEGDDHVAAGQARNLLVDAAKKVKELAGKVEWPARVTEYEELITEARKVVHEYGDAGDQSMLESLVAEGERAVRDKDPRMLARAEKQLRQLCLAMLQKDPGFWASRLAHLAEQEHTFLDRGRARTLLNEGAMAMRRNDAAALASVVRELYQLLPPDAKAEATAVIGSGII